MKNKILLFFFVANAMVAFSQSKKPLPLLLKNIYDHKTDHQLKPLPPKNHVDYSIRNFQETSNPSNLLELENKGSIASPFSIHLFANDSILSIIDETGFKKNKAFNLPSADFTKIKIAAEEDPFVHNNTLLQKKHLKKLEPLKFHSIVAEQNSDFTQLFITPIVGWNYHDRMLYGAAFHNNPLAISKFKYLILPLYSSKRQNIAGNINVSYSFYPKWLPVNYVSLGVNSKRYGYNTFEYLSDQMQLYTLNDLAYTKFAPELHIDFSSPTQETTKKYYLTLRNIHIAKDVVSIVPLPVGVDFAVDETSYYMNTLLLAIEERKKNNPYSLYGRVEQNNKIIKASAEYIQKLNYNAYKKQLKLRLFYGTFLYKDGLGSFSEDFRFRLSSWAGHHDYLYDYHFIGRQATNKEILNQQTVVRDGGFKAPTTLGQTWDWLGAINLDVPFPGKIPLGIYLDAGVFINKEGNTYQDPSVMYDAGARISIIREVFEIYLPAILSEDIRENLDLNKDNYSEKIRFSLYLNKLNPLKERIIF